MAEVFDHVYVLVSAVVSCTWVTFTVLVSETGAVNLHDGFVGKVFASNKLNAAVLSLFLKLDEIV